MTKNAASNDDLQGNQKGVTKAWGAGISVSFINRSKSIEVSISSRLTKWRWFCHRFTTLFVGGDGAFFLSFRLVSALFTKRQSGHVTYA